MNKRYKNNKSGFTLIELMIVVGVLSFTIAGMMQLYFFVGKHIEMAGNITRVLNDTQNKIEEMRSHNYDDIVADYAIGGVPGNTFALTGLTGIGAVTIDNTDPDLLIIRVVASWRDRFNYTIGEDANFNGILDEGEDANGDGVISSPVMLMTMIANRD